MKRQTPVEHWCFTQCIFTCAMLC